MQLLTEIKEAFSELVSFSKSEGGCPSPRRASLLKNCELQRNSADGASLAVMASGRAPIASHWEHEDYSLDRLGLPVVIFDDTRYNDGNYEDDDVIQGFFEVM